MSKSLLMNSVSMFKDNKKSILNKNVKSIHNQIRWDNVIYMLL